MALGELHPHEQHDKKYGAVRQARKSGDRAGAPGTESV